MIAPAAYDTRPALSALAILLSVSAVLAYAYFRTVDRPYREARLDLHERILRGDAPEPYRFRVLAPAAAETLRRVFSAAVEEEWAFLLAYAAFDFAAIALFLWLLYRYLAAWFTAEQALIGALFAAATMPVALRDHFFQPWSLLEAALFTAGLLCIHRRRRVLLAAVVAIASFNRETGIFIPIAYLLAEARPVGGAEPERGRVLARRLYGAALLALWAAVFFGLRAAIGRGASAGTVAGILAYNVSGPVLARALLRGALIFGAFWIFAALGIRRAPRFVRRTAFVAPLYLAAIGLWGGWHEARLLLPLYAVIVPCALSRLYSPRLEQAYRSAVRVPFDS